MVLVHVSSVVVLTTGETTTTWVLAVLADTTVTGGNVSTVLSGLGKVGRHLLVCKVDESLLIEKSKRRWKTVV